MSAPFLPPTQWYASLPTVHMSAVVVLTDTIDQVLVVKPSYRPYWQLPGGVAEAGEPPHACAEREVAEEVGLRVTAGPLLVLAWIPASGERPMPMLTFAFEGGVVAEPGRVRLQDSELEDAAWVSWDKAAAMLPRTTAAIVPAARDALATGRTAYLPVDLSGGDVLDGDERPARRRAGRAGPI